MIESSPKRSIIIQFFAWHFAEVPKALLNGFGNLLVFNLQFFSIGALLATLFSHWRRFKDSYGRGLKIAKNAANTSAMNLLKNRVISGRPWEKN